MFFALAHPLTLVVLGAKWEAAAVIFAALSFATLLTPLGACASWLITSQGRGKDAFLASWIVSVIMAASFIAGLPYGPAGVAIAYSASSLLIQTPVYYWLVGRSGPVRTSDLWIGLLKHLPVWVVVTLVSWLTLTAVPGLSPLVQLIICIPAGLLAGIAFIFIYSPSRRIAAGFFSIVRALKNPAPAAESARAGAAPGEANPSALLPGISVVIPTYNRDRLVKRAIESVLNQTIKADQIIVVDDGSTDGTPEMCRRFSGSIEYIHQSNGGVSQARNHGIKLARYAWIAFLDSDDHWTPNHLESIKTAIKDTDGKARFYFTNALITGEARETTLWSQIGFKLDAPYLFVPDCTDWMLGCRQPASIQSSVFNAALLKASDGFDQRVEPREDAELFCRLGIGGSACAVNAVGCIYTGDDNTDTRLTTKVHVYTEQYWKRACMLWSLLDSHFPDLDPKYRRVIHEFLADAYWRLTRIHWKSGRFFQGLSALFQCLAAQPSFLVMHLGRLKSAKWDEVEGRPVLQSEPKKIGSTAGINAQTTCADQPRYPGS
jgi:glycosyltransferase involved in cell wall biosynthesis